MFFNLKINFPIITKIYILDILKKKKCYETEIYFLNEARDGIAINSNTKIIAENEKITANHELIREDGKSIARIKTIWLWIMNRTDLLSQKYAYFFNCLIKIKDLE